MTRRIPGSGAIGIRIERLMEERGMRAAHLDEELGLHEGAASRWLRGGGFSEDHLDAMAGFFDTTPAWIVTGTGPMHPEIRGSAGDADLTSLDEARDRQGRGAGKARRRRA